MKREREQRKNEVLNTSLRTACAVKQPVASLDGIVNSIGTSGIVDLPQAKADLGHLVAIVEGDERDV